MVNLFHRFSLRLRLYIIYNFINYFLLAVLSQKEKPWTAIEKKPHTKKRIKPVRVLTLVFLCSFDCIGSSNFIDLNTGYSLSIDYENKRYRIHDESSHLKFCADDSKYICMQSIHINYAIPKARPLPKTWAFEGKTYCYVEVLNFKLSDEQVEEAYLVARSENGSCKSLSGKEPRFIYGDKTGLIYFDSFSSSGFQRRFIREEY